MGCDIHGFIEVLDNGKWKKLCDLPYDGRSYLLFSQLANVRNHDDNDYLEAKGYPEDASVEIDDDWYHSHTHFTIKELEDFLETHPTIKVSGSLSARQQRALEKGILPTSYCSGTSDLSFKEVEWVAPNDCLSVFIEDIKGSLNKEDIDNVRVVVWFDN